jgi:branched-chain amino acid transport system substrate-binding protein
MKRSIPILIATAIVLVILGTSMGSQEPTGSIIIGNLQDLSGATSVWGNAVRKGAELAIEQINNQGGVLGMKLELKSYDVKADPNESITAYNRLVDSDKAVVVIGPPISNIGLALTSLTEQKKVAIVGSFIDPRVTVKPDGKPQPYMFLMQPSSIQYAEILADYAVKKLGIKTVAVFYNQANSFAVSQVGPFKTHWSANGGTVLAEEIYKTGDRDFKTQLSKIKESGAQSIYAPNYLQELVLLLQQMDQIGLKIPVIGGLDFAPPFTTLLSDPKLADKIYFANNYSDSEPQLIEVRKAYMAKFNEEPVNKVYLGYDKVLMIVDAIKRANSTDPTKIRDALEQLKNLQGTTGVISISPTNHQPVGLSMVMYSIMGGQYSDLGRWVPDAHK